MHRSGPLCAAMALALTYISVPDPTATAQSKSGTIEGRITFAGTPPPATVLTQDGDSQAVLYVDRSGGPRYAVAYPPDAR